MNDMHYNTPLVLGHTGVEIVSVMPAIKEIGMLIHVNCMPDQVQTPEIRKDIYNKSKISLKYLMDEGFANITFGWKPIVALVFHPPESYENEEKSF